MNPLHKAFARRRLHLAGPAIELTPPDDTAIPEFLVDDTPPPVAVRATEAARGFTAGNGYIPGLIIDRLA